MKREATVLIIEDDKVMARALEEAFKLQGFASLVSHDGAEGLELIRTKVPGAVLLDVLLPGKNGLEVLEEVKRDPKLASIPILLLTNLEDVQTVQKALALGGFTYLVKSDYTPFEVVEKVKERLGMGKV